LDKQPTSLRFILLLKTTNKQYINNIANNYLGVGTFAISLVPSPSLAIASISTRQCPFITVIYTNISIADACTSTFIMATGHKSGTATGASTSTSTIYSAKGTSIIAGRANISTLLPLPLCPTTITAAGPKTSTTAARSIFFHHCCHYWYLHHRLQYQYLRLQCWCQYLITILARFILSTCWL